MSDRSATTYVRLKFKSAMACLLDDGWLSSLTMGGWLVRKRLLSGVETDEANRAWEYEVDITSGSNLDVNLRNMTSVDIGAGSGNDALGQAMSLEEIVLLAVKNVSGAGSLEVMSTDPDDKLAWVPTLTVAGGGALDTDGVLLMYQPHADAFDVSVNWNKLRLRAMGGDVTAHIYVLGRHDDEASSSSSSSVSSSSSSSTSMT